MNYGKAPIDRCRLELKYVQKVLLNIILNCCRHVIMVTHEMECLVQQMQAIFLQYEDWHVS